MTPAKKTLIRLRVSLQILQALQNRYPFDDIGIVARSQECIPLETPSFAINAQILVNITH
jgi:hypothetical protein